jgi:hypothetical protein
MLLSQVGEGPAQAIHIHDAFTDSVEPLWSQPLAGRLGAVVHHSVTNQVICHTVKEGEGIISAWDVNSGALLYCITDLCLYYDERSTMHVSMSFNSLGTKFLTGLTTTRETVIWDASNGLKLLTLLMPPICRAAFTLDSSEVDRVVTFQVTGECRVWDVESGKELRGFQAFDAAVIYPHSPDIDNLSMGRETSLVAALAIFFVDEDLTHRLGVWNYSTGEKIFLVEDYSFCRFAIGPDDNTLLSGSARHVAVYDIKSGTKRFLIEGNFAFSPPVIDRVSGYVLLLRYISERMRFTYKLDVTTEELIEGKDVAVTGGLWLLCVPPLNVLL